MIKPIPSYEGLYTISESGDVMNSNRKKPVKAKIDRYGYLRLGIHNGFGKRKWFTIHRLVALTYIPNPNNLPCVNHIDGNKLNNHVSNLEWISVLENVRHSWRIGKSKHSSLATQRLLERTQKKVKQFDLNGIFIKEWNGIREAERGTKSNSSRIIKVCKGIFKQHHGFIWKYS